uniref:Secreted protein n=1 Tax=Aegilops tauschii subsp. strangulata TaxID=200361 RepID=A0A453N2W6_AEGTS
MNFSRTSFRFSSSFMTLSSNCSMAEITCRVCALGFDGAVTTPTPNRRIRFRNYTDQARGALGNLPKKLRARSREYGNGSHSTGPQPANSKICKNSLINRI